MTHKNKGSVQVSAVFLLELLVMLVSKLHIGSPECCLFVSGGCLWFECLNSLVNSKGCSEIIHMRSVNSLLLLLSDQIGKARLEDSDKPATSPGVNHQQPGQIVKLRTAHYRKPVEGPRCPSFFSMRRGIWEGDECEME